VQQTTFNSAYQADGSEIYFSPHQWLDALYSEASQKKIDQSHFKHLLNAFESFTFLEKELDYSFNDKNILAQAFLQTTFCHENKALDLESNERLEFFGDSLLGAMVAEVLIAKHKKMSEGHLSKLRGSLVNEAELAKLARTISLEDNLFLGKGEFKSHGHLKDSILADAFESLLAAVYLDSDKDFVCLKQVFSRIISLYEKKTEKEFYAADMIDDFDSKSKLQELCVAKRGVFPVYKSHTTNEGFIIEVWIGEEMIASQNGISKKKSEKELAKKIIEENLY
jgi:ribonuclease-3